MTVPSPAEGVNDWWASESFLFTGEAKHYGALNKCLFILFTWGIKVEVFKVEKGGENLGLSRAVSTNHGHPIWTPERWEAWPHINCAHA